MPSNKVLVIDDDEDLRDAIGDLLRIRGYDVEFAQDGREALDRLTAGLPAVILLDMRMPGMNGWEFARIFRQRHNHHAPLIVLTAAADAQERAAEIGAEDWLGKPFESSELFAVVARQIASC